MMKIEEGSAIQHRDNPRWKGRVVKDLDPKKPTNGYFLVYTPSGELRRMLKTLARLNRAEINR